MRKKYNNMGMSEEKPDSGLTAIDGLLLEMGRNGTGNDLAFLRDVMAAAQNDEEVKKHHFFTMFRIAISLAAAIVAVSAVIFIFYGRMPSGAVDEKDKMPCILVCSPGGLIKSGNKEEAIINGMSLKADDTVHIFKSKSAFVQFSSLASMEIGAGSIIQFNDIHSIADKRQKLSGSGIALKDGVIQADISGLKDGAAFTVATTQGAFMTQKSSFMLIKTPELCFMEVRDGSVRFKDKSGSLSVINAGQSRIIQEKNTGVADSTMTINEYKDRLTLQSRDIEELLLQLTKKKKADICLREIIKKRNMSL